MNYSSPAPSRCEGHHDESGKRHDFSDLAGVLGQPIAPFEIELLHPEWRPLHPAREYVKRPADPDQNGYFQLLAVRRDPLLLLRNAQGHAKYIRSCGIDGGENFRLSLR